MNTFKKIVDWCNRILGWAALAFLAVTVIACALQVFTRYVLNNSLIGTEEVARYAFIWMSCLGFGICTQQGAHAAVTLLSDKFTRAPAVKAVYTIVIHVMICIFSYIMIFYGFELLSIVRKQYSPTLGIRMDIMYSSIPIGGLTIMLNAVYIICSNVQSLMKKEG